MTQSIMEWTGDAVRGAGFRTTVLHRSRSFWHNLSLMCCLGYRFLIISGIYKITTYTIHPSAGLNHSCSTVCHRSCTANSCCPFSTMIEVCAFRAKRSGFSLCLFPRSSEWPELLPRDNNKIPRWPQIHSSSFTQGYANNQWTKISPFC